MTRALLTKILIGTLLLTMFSPLSQGMASAQSEVPASVSIQRVDGDPGYFDLEMKPGESLTVEIVLIVEGRSAAAVTYVPNLVMNDNGGYQPAPIDEEAAGVTTWISYPTEQLQLEIDRPLTRALTITVPEDAQPGEYTSAVVLETTDGEIIGEEAQTDQEIAVQFRQISRFVLGIAITVPGAMTAKLAIGESYVESDMTGTYLVIAIRNEGNVRLKPDCDVTLTDQAGTVVLRSAFKMETFLSGTETNLRIRFGVVPPLGDYLLDLKVSEQEHQLAEAVTTATVTIDELALTVKETSDVATSAQIMAMEVLETRVGDQLQFVEPVISITNPTQELRNASVLLTVFRDGVLLETYPLATGITIATGDSQIRQRYIPVDGWQPGTYAFTVSLESIDPTTGTSVLVSQYASPQVVTVP